MDSHHGFDFTQAMRTLCADVVVRSPAMRHIQLERVAFNVCQTRQDVPHGLYASLTPLRFKSGATSTFARGAEWEVEQLLDEAGEPYLYLLSFYLPRFQNISLEEKLTTVFHELWHISPRFDGDVRRHPGRCYAHGRSQKEYDAHVTRLAQEWLARNPPSHLFDFLSYNFSGLVAEFGKVSGSRWAAPKLVRRRA